MPDHADRNELLTWQRALSTTYTILVHDEEDVMRCLADELHGSEVNMLRKGNGVRL